MGYPEWFSHKGLVRQDDGHKAEVSSEAYPFCKIVKDCAAKLNINLRTCLYRKKNLGQDIKNAGQKDEKNKRKK